MRKRSYPVPVYAQAWFCWALMWGTRLRHASWPFPDCSQGGSFSASRCCRDPIPDWEIARLSQVAGARWRAIIQRHRLAPGFIELSTYATELLSSHGEPHWPVAIAAFASRGYTAAAPEAVAGVLAAGGIKELGETAGGGLVAAIIERARKVFGSDARSVDALERAQRDEPGAADELASALAWYAQRSGNFVDELAGWAVQAGTSGLTQRIRAGRDAYTAGGDQTVFNYRRPDE
jgi:hypothetical protein